MSIATSKIRGDVKFGDTVVKGPKGWWRKDNRGKYVRVSKYILLEKNDYLNNASNRSCWLLGLYQANEKRLSDSSYKGAFDYLKNKEYEKAELITSDSTDVMWIVFLVLIVAISISGFIAFNM